MLILIGTFLGRQEVYTNVFYGFLLCSRTESITLLCQWAMESNRTPTSITMSQCIPTSNILQRLVYIYCYQHVPCSVFGVIKITDGKQRGLGRKADDSSTKVVNKNTWRFYLHYLPPCAFMEWSRTTLTLQCTSH